MAARVTFIWVPISFMLAVQAMSQDNSLPDLPRGLTSFGAAVCDGHLYVYGGNLGGAHGYSAETQNDQLLCLELDGGKWETLGEVPRRQGNALVSWNHQIYQLGGFEARNGQGEPEDYVSQAGVAAFDPQTGQWSDLPPLPEPRSSFDAVVMGSELYVVGGWDMQSGETRWHDTAWKMNLAAKPLKWIALPRPPFTRRAHSLCYQAGKIYVIGGMTEEGPTTRVDVYDPETETWSEGPALPGQPMSGFGNSSFHVGDVLLVTTNSGLTLRLSADGQSWHEMQGVGEGRMFHRLVALDEERYVIVGGTRMGAGKQTATLIGRAK